MFSSCAIFRVVATTVEAVVRDENNATNIITGLITSWYRYAKGALRNTVGGIFVEEGPPCPPRPIFKMFRVRMSQTIIKQKRHMFRENAALVTGPVPKNLPRCTMPRSVRALLWPGLKAALLTVGNRPLPVGCTRDVPGGSVMPCFEPLPEASPSSSPCQSVSTAVEASSSLGMSLSRYPSGGA